MTTPINNDKLNPPNPRQTTSFCNRSLSLPNSTTHSVAQLAISNSSVSSNSSLEARIETVHLQKNKQKNMDRYGSLYPFLRGMLDEIEKFNQFQNSFCVWEICLDRMDLKEILGISKGSQPVFGKAKSIQEAIKIYQKKQSTPSLIENTPTQIFMKTFQDLDSEELAICLNIMSSLADLKSNSDSVSTFEAKLLKSSNSQTICREFDIFNNALINFSITCHNQFKNENDIFEQAHKDFLQSKQLVLQAIIHLLKTILKKNSLLFIDMNENEQRELALLLNHIRDLYEGGNLEPIPFQLVAESLNTIIMNHPNLPSSDISSSGTPLRLSTSKSLPNVKSQRTYFSSPTPRTSPILKRHYNKDGSFLKSQTVDSSSSLNRHVHDRSRITRFVTKQESSLIPSFKNLQLINQTLQNEKFSLSEGKQGELTVAYNKLDEKGIKTIFKYLESILVRLINLQDAQQLHIFNEILGQLEKHTQFKNLCKTNPSLHDTYLKIHVKALYGGNLFTYEQLQIYRQNLYNFLIKNNVPEDFSVDIYGQEILVHEWFHPKYTPSNSMRSTLSFLKSPAERYRIRITEYNMNKRQHYFKLEPFVQSIKSIHQIRSQYLHFSKQIQNDAEFIITVAKEIGLKELLKYMPEFNSQSTFLEAIESLINTENKIESLTPHETPSLKLVQEEFSDEINEIKSYPTIFIKMVQEVFLFLSEKETSISAYENALNELLRSPYIDVLSVLKLLDSGIRKLSV